MRNLWLETLELYYNEEVVVRAHSPLFTMELNDLNDYLGIIQKYKEVMVYGLKQC